VKILICGALFSIFVMTAEAEIQAQILAEQNLEGTSPLFGSNKKESGDEAQWDAFRYSLFSPWYLTGLAVAAGLDSPVNPLFQPTRSRF
jgi:hypothetical protein